MYFFTGSTHEGEDDAAEATPDPSTAEAPTDAAMTATRVRTRDVREERGETRWNIRNLMKPGTGNHPAHDGVRMGHPLVTPKAKDPKTAHLRRTVVMGAVMESDRSSEKSAFHPESVHYSA
ncbi:hypothetical protein TUSST3_26160 [Streptomyces sp. TUS-ST3]|nr:hypothetical protein TUSST3_26160 [Streptomyces sp. TUS-ST3]